MILFLAILLFLIFLFLSLLHVYWIFGGKWASQAVLPTKPNQTTAIKPGVFATFIVALGLFGFGVLAIFCTISLDFSASKLLHFLHEYGLVIIFAIFLVRAIGDFNYVGFFKKIKNTSFGINDTKYYSPLCLFISLLAGILNYFR